MGCSWWCHRSRHCLPMRPGKWAATELQLPSPILATSLHETRPKLLCAPRLMPAARQMVARAGFQAAVLCPGKPEAQQGAAVARQGTTQGLGLAMQTSRAQKRQDNSGRVVTQHQPRWSGHPKQATPAINAGGSEGWPLHRWLYTQILQRSACLWVPLAVNAQEQSPANRSEALVLHKVLTT